jgi:hypothetical protein
MGAPVLLRNLHAEPLTDRMKVHACTIYLVTRPKLPFFEDCWQRSGGSGLRQHFNACPLFIVEPLGRHLGDAMDRPKNCRVFPSPY